MGTDERNEGTKDKSRRLVEVEEPEGDGDPGLLTVEQLLSLRQEPWLVEWLLRRGDLGMVFGASGVGKTFVAMDLISSAIAGKPFAGRFAIPDPLRVAYAAGEGVSGLPARVAAALAHHGADADARMRLLLRREVVKLYENGDAAGFAAAVRRRGIELDLLVIDTLHAASEGADENSARDAGHVVSSLQRLARDMDCAVLVTHHANRAGNNLRGSTAYDAALSLVIELRGEGGKGRMRCAKSKDAAPFDDMAFRLEPYRADPFPESRVVVWSGQEAGAASQGVRELLTSHLGSGERFTVRELAQALGTKEGSVNNELRRMGQEGIVNSRKRGRALEYELAKRS